MNAETPALGHRTLGIAQGAPGSMRTRKALVHILPSWRNSQAYCGVWLREKFTEDAGILTPEPTCRKCIKAAAS